MSLLQKKENYLPGRSSSRPPLSGSMLVGGRVPFLVLLQGSPWCDRRIPIRGVVPREHRANFPLNVDYHHLCATKGAHNITSGLWGSRLSYLGHKGLGQVLKHFVLSSLRGSFVTWIKISENSLVARASASSPHRVAEMCHAACHLASRIVEVQII